MGEIVTPQDLVGNASYILLAASYLVTNIYWLRLLAIVALTAEAVYFYMAGDRELWVGILWAGIFNVINIAQLIRLTRNRMKVRMSDEERTLHSSIFGRLEKVDFSRVLAAGAFEDLPEGAVLTEQGRAVDHVRLLLSGRATVFVDGAPIAVLSAGDFIGEMAYIGRCDASASVITEGRCRAFRIPIADLRALTSQHEKIETVMNDRFSVDLARKLRTRPLAEPALRRAARAR